MTTIGGIDPLAAALGLEQHGASETRRRESMWWAGAHGLILGSAISSHCSVPLALARTGGRLPGPCHTVHSCAPVTEADRKIQNLAISIANRDLPTYWHGFDDEDRVAFDTNYFRLLQAICSPIPKITADTLRAAVRSGRLRIGIGEAVATPAGWRVGEETFDAVVDGTGAATNAEQVLFEDRLIAGGSAFPERFGGICVELATGNVLSPRGGRSRMYAIGYATRGSLLYSSSLYQATRNIKRVVADIVRAGELLPSASGQAKEIARGSFTRQPEDQVGKR